MSDWIVTGSAPSGRAWLRRLASTYPDAKTIAANRAAEWHLEDGIRLDYCLIFDMHASVIYYEMGLKARAHGAKLVTLNRSKESLRKRKLDHFDEFIPAGRFRGKPDWYARGEYNDFGLSGFWALQYAINNGATTIHLPGHEGYRGRTSDYDSGIPHPRANEITFGIIEPGFAAVTTGCRDIQFVFYGDLAYTIPSQEHVTIIRTEAPCFAK
jgi:hypothetical protein